jgi:hypothetical protein
MNFLKNFILFIVSLCLVLFLAEFVVRFALADITSTANMQTWFGQRWKAEYVTPNSLGFRDVEFSPPKPDGVYRIAVIGDSFAYGQGLPVSKRFSNIIEQTLNTSGSRYEVLNFSLPGNSASSEVHIMQKIVLPLDPDFILVQWLPNDLITASIVRGPGKPNLISNTAWHKKARANSALYFLLNNQWFKLSRSLGINNFSYGENLMTPFRDPGSEEFKTAFQPMTDLLAGLQASGKDYALVLHPLLQPDLGRNYLMQPLHDLVMEECRKVEARCIDLAPQFVAYGVAYGVDYDFTQLWVNRFDGHPGVEANQLVADYIIQELGSEAWSYTSE